MLEPPEPPLVTISDQQFPARFIRELAAKMALDKGRHVHYVEDHVIYCLSEHCIYEES